MSTVNYDNNRKLAEDYLDVIRQKVYAINWQIPNGTIPGREAVRTLSTAPGVGELTSFTWLAFVGTPCRFPNVKALNAYSSLDPSVRVSAGKVTSTKKRGDAEYYTQHLSGVPIALFVPIPKVSVRFRSLGFPYG